MVVSVNDIIMDEEKEKFSPPIENGAIENEEQMSEESDDFDANDAEYEDLNHQLDQINSCLDLLEQQNDALKAELQNFLLSSRQARNEGKVDQSDEMVDSSSCSDDDTKCS